jgi:hypothetical protein
LYHKVVLTDALADLIAEYAAFNPHASFDFNGTSYPRLIRPGLNGGPISRHPRIGIGPKICAH